MKRRKTYTPEFGEDAVDLLRTNDHLAELTWDNPHPNLEISPIEFKAMTIEASPFLLGITAE